MLFKLMFNLKYLPQKSVGKTRQNVVSIRRQLGGLYKFHGEIVAITWIFTKTSNQPPEKIKLIRALQHVIYNIYFSYPLPSMMPKFFL